MALPKSAFEQFLADEGVRVHTGYSISDVAEAERAPWKRWNADGAVFNLRGMDGFTASFVIEVPAHSELPVQRHMYEEVLYALRGHPSVVLSDRDQNPPMRFDLQIGSLMAVPLNCPYQVVNDSDEAALVFGVTDMPLAMDLFYSPEYIFGSDAWFEDRVDAVRAAKRDGTKTEISGRGNLVIEAAQIDGAHIGTDPSDLEGSRDLHGMFSMAGNTLAGHLAGEAVGQYDHAHYHGGGATILILQSHGYSLMWPPEYGTTPFRSGFGDKVVRAEWKAGSIISPPTAWFHQHFNLGDTTARNIAFRFGYGLSRPTRFYIGTHDVNGHTACTVDHKIGGTRIEYEDEDPQIHQDYDAALAAEGRSCHMDHSLLSIGV